MRLSRAMGAPCGARRCYGAIIGTHRIAAHHGRPTACNTVLSIVDGGEAARNAWAYKSVDTEPHISRRWSSTSSTGTGASISPLARERELRLGLASVLEPFTARSIVTAGLVQVPAVRHYCFANYPRMFMCRVSTSVKMAILY
jgi:hypothetical protein